MNIDREHLDEDVWNCPGPEYHGSPAFKAAVGSAYEDSADNQYIGKEH